MADKVFHELTTPTVVLARGESYAAKVVVTGMASMFATPSAVQEKLSRAGFSGVTVWRTPLPQLADDEPVRGKTFWAIGTWMGTEQRIVRPPEIARLWECRAP